MLAHPPGCFFDENQKLFYDRAASCIRYALFFEEVFERTRLSVSIVIPKKEAI